MNTISKTSDRIEEVRELLCRGIEVVFLAAVIVFLACLVALIAAFTFAVLHNGDDFDFGAGRGNGADIIVLPVHRI